MRKNCPLARGNNGQEPRKDEKDEKAKNHEQDSDHRDDQMDNTV
jgi:hypothetical protein